jgi:tetratricopeptide (TPR) repeat protein
VEIWLFNNNSIGYLYFLLKKYDKAEEHYLKARTFWKESLGENHPYYTNNTLNLARVYWLKNDIMKAAEMYQMAFDAQAKQAGEIFSFTSEEEKQFVPEKCYRALKMNYHSFYYEKFKKWKTTGSLILFHCRKENLVLSSSQPMRQIIYSSNDPVLQEKYDD